VSKTGNLWKDPTAQPSKRSCCSCFISLRNCITICRKERINGLSDGGPLVVRSELVFGEGVAVGVGVSVAYGHDSLPIVVKVPGEF
jgi:hypothetical protein